MKPTAAVLKKRARRILTGNMGVPIRAMLIASLLPLLLEYPFTMLQNFSGNSLFQTVLYYLVIYLLGIIGEVLSIGRCLVHICLARGEIVTPSLVFYGFSNRSNHYFTGAILLQTISFAISLPLSLAMEKIDLSNPDPATNLALLRLFLVMSLLRLLMRILFGLFYYIMLDDEDFSIRQNLRKNFVFLKGNCLRLLGLSVSFLGLELLSMLAMGIPLLWISPYKEQSFAMLYLAILKEKENA